MNECLVASFWGSGSGWGSGAAGGEGSRPTDALVLLLLALALFLAAAPPAETGGGGGESTVAHRNLPVCSLQEPGAHEGGTGGVSPGGEGVLNIVNEGLD